MQASRFGHLSFDPLTLLLNSFVQSEVYVCRCDVFDARLISSVIVVTDEGFDLCSEFTRQEVVSQQDAVDVVWGIWTGAKTYPT